MKKLTAVIIACILVLSVSVIAYSGDDWGYADGDVRITPIADAYNKSVCLKDGTNCPSTLNASGTVTSITATGPYLTGGTITTTGTIAVNTSAFCLATGVNCLAGSSLTLPQWLLNWSSSNIGNATSLAAGLVNLTLAQVNTNMQNWSRDRSSYVNFTVLGHQNNLSLAQIVANVGNWSADKSSYTLLSQFNSNNNLSLAQIVSNIGNWSLDKSSYTLLSQFNSNNNLSLSQISTNLGNWSADKATYLQNNTHANFTKLSINTSPQATYNGSCWNFTGATSQWLVC